MTLLHARKLIQEIEVFVDTIWEFTWEQVFDLISWLEADLKWVLFVFSIVTMLVCVTPFSEADCVDPVRDSETCCCESFCL